MNPRQKKTTIAAVAGGAALLVGLTAIGTVAVTDALYTRDSGMFEDNPTVTASSTRTWEPEGGELGEAVFVGFVRDSSGTGFSKSQIVDDVQDICRDFAAGKSTDKMVTEARAGGDYGIALLAGSVNFYCTEFESRLP